MNSDIEAVAKIPELTNNEFALFKSALHTLLSKTFIIRGIEKEKELYDFTIRNIVLFDAWFSCMDAELKRDESLGVITFRAAGDLRLRLGRDDTCALLALRQLYEEKRIELHLTAFPVITIQEFQQKFNIMTGDELKKTGQIKVLQRLSSCKLIGINQADISDPDGQILLYPSIPLSVDREGIDELIAVLMSKSDSDDTEDDDGAAAALDAAPDTESLS
ncbi:MAG: DUF4194 domain-containing protein [Treponema sp.]|jgi:hypothetical protein|nr:DUF4194 domain-containing protein [Treponema sp.]